MLLEQITTDYEDDDDQQPAPKGMVRTEMGRLVKKADQDAWEKKSMAAMQAQLKSRGASSLKEKKVGYALKSMSEKMVSDNTKSKKPYIKTPAKRNAEEKVKIAKDLYESSPVGYKYRQDILDTMKARLSRIKE
jgi:hypothetical protein